MTFSQPAQPWIIEWSYKFKFKKYQLETKLKNSFEIVKLKTHKFFLILHLMISTHGDLIPRDRLRLQANLYYR